MKVEPKDQIVPALPSTSTPIPSQTALGTTPVQDTSSQDLAQAVKVAVGNVDATRDARIKELTTAVSSGTYQPSAEGIASAILEQAELDAQLAAGG